MNGKNQASGEHVHECKDCKHQMHMKSAIGSTYEALVCARKKMKDGRPKKVKFFAGEHCSLFEPKEG